MASYSLVLTTSAAGLVGSQCCGHTYCMSPSPPYHSENTHSRIRFVNGPRGEGGIDVNAVLGVCETCSTYSWNAQEVQHKLGFLHHVN